MPMGLQDDVFGSTLRDSIHIGPNQAGNKGMLSYNANLGIPGYTGFCPAPAAIQIPIKGTTVHTGKRVDQATHDAVALSTVGRPDGAKRATEQKEQFVLHPSQTVPTDRTGGGYWFSQRQVCDDVPLQGTTVYRSEMLNGGDTATNQLMRSSGVLSTLSGYEAARQRAGSAPRDRYAAHLEERAEAAAAAAAAYAHLPIHLQSALGATGRPATAVVAGTVVGYQTTYSSMIVPNPLVGGLVAAGRPGPPGSAPSSFTISRSPSLYTAAGGTGGGTVTGAGGGSFGGTVLIGAGAVGGTVPYTAGGTVEARHRVMPRVMAPGLHGVQSTYGIEFGLDGSDPMERAAPSETYQTRLATTRDLAHGTSRNGYPIPGYAGHLPESKYNLLGKGHIDSAQGKVSQKNDMTLYNLDQFGRSRVPHYTGYKPQAAPNITMDQPSQGPSTATTSGHANQMATRRGVPQQDHSNYINGRTGIMTFFSSPGEYVSDNGLTNAQLYFKTMKPGDGRLDMSQTSKVTDYGAKFNSRNSLV